MSTGMRRRDRGQDPEKHKSRAKQNNSDTKNDSLTIKDILRMVGGLIFLNLVLSYYVTGTPLWGSETRWTNPRYISFQFNKALNGNKFVTLTEAELSQYTGEDPSKPIYVAVAGKVYDVTSKPHTYGPAGAYSFFAGRDAARAYVTGCFQTDLTHDLRQLEELFAQKTIEAKIQGWQRFYEKNPKYWYVGQVQHPPLTGAPPKLCKGQQYPGS